MIRYSWLSLVIVVADQVTKHLAVAWLGGQSPLELTSFARLTLAYNTGAAFGLLDDAGGWQNGFFVFVAVAVSMFILVMLRRLTRRDWPLALALALILGGALGNVIDRLMYSHVIDFIDLYYRGWHWPAFNVADSAISAGAVLLVLDALFARRVNK